MKAVIYARYSSENQREESIEGQIRECTAFAEKNGITILKHYIDRAYSAKTDNRPEFQRMIQDCKEKLFDMILVWKLDRFSRNRYDSIIYKHTLKKMEYVWFRSMNRFPKVQKVFYWNLFWKVLRNTSLLTWQKRLTGAWRTDCKKKLSRKTGLKIWS